MRRQFRVSLLLIVFLVSFTFGGLQFVSVHEASANPDPDIGYNSHPTGYNFAGYTFPNEIWNLTYAYDKKNDTFTKFNYGKVPKPGPGYYQVRTFSSPSWGANPPTITSVDFKMRWKADANIKDETYQIEFYLGATGPKVLVAATGAAHTLSTDTWSFATKPAEVGGGSWAWTDVSTIVFRVTSPGLAGGTMDSMFYLYEAWVTVVLPEPTPKIYVNPPSYVDLTKTKGTSISVDVAVDNAAKLWGFQFELSYNPFLITPTGNYSHSPFYTTFPMTKDDMVGWLFLAYSMSFAEPVGFWGDGPLVTINFNVELLGETDLTMSNSELSNIYGQILTHTYADGYFRNVDAAKIPIVVHDYSPKPPGHPLEGETVTFDATGSTPDGGAIANYTWYFGDGTSLVTTIHPTVTTTHVYPSLGTYTVVLRVWDTEGVIGSGQVKITVIVLSHDIAIAAVDRNATEVPVGATVELNVTVKNEGNFSETFDITTYYYGYLALRAEDNGTHTAWGNHTAHWDDWAAFWRDPPSHDIDGTYVTATADNLKETSTFMDHTLETWSIKYIEVSVVARNNETSDDNVTIMIRTGGSDYLGASFTPTTTYQTYAHEWSTNPAGGAWTWAAIDSLEAGVKSTQVGGTFDGQLRVTQIYIEVYGTWTAVASAETVTSLAAGANVTVTFNWDTTGVPRTMLTWIYPYTISVSNTTAIAGETDIADNTFIDGPVDIGVSDIAITDVELFGYLALRPDADGTYTSWTNDYTYWDDWPGNDTDTTYVSVTANNLNETSTFANHTTQSWTIEKVTLVMVARRTGGDDLIRMMLVIDGEGYNGSIFQPHVTYAANYTSEWTKNPKTDAAWTWSDIDKLEAGVRSVQVGASFTELRVTKIHLEVSGTPVTSLSVEPGEELKVAVTAQNQGNFTQTFNVTAYYDSNPIGIAVNWTIEKQFTGFEEILWNTTGVSQATYTIKAEVSSTISYETDTADNTFTDGTVTVVSAVPEFPFGAALEIALIIAVLYIWWRTKQRKEQHKQQTIRHWPVTKAG